MKQLYGPFGFDPAVPQASARAALAAFIEAGRAPGWVPPDVPPYRPPGLYLLVEAGEGRARLGGFWISFGAWYLRSGPPGAPDRTPPFVGALLDAATEAVWWRAFPVAPATGSAWRPVIVLEWPPALAERSTSPPPGVILPTTPEEDAGGDEGRWLLPGAAQPRKADTRRGAGAGRPGGGLPPERSLLTVVRAQLEHDASTHEGRFFVMGANRFVGGEGAAIPLEAWLSVGAAPERKEPLPDEHGLGEPLELPRGGVGYPMSGWLTRALDVWPTRPADVVPGSLARRDVRSVRVAQGQLAVVLTVLVFAPVLLLALVVRQLTESRPEDAERPEAVAPQPAISACSADHQKFVEELRCQVARLAAGSGPEDIVCRDDGSTDQAPVPEDLQPEVCGLLDRARDGGTLSFRRAGQAIELDPGEFAAAQACFNVLEHPEPYEVARLEGDPRRRIGAPTVFLDEPALAIEPLRAIVSELDVVCDGYRTRLESRVSGAIFATHVGLPLTEVGRMESADLRQRLTDLALEGEATTSGRDCFLAGVKEGLRFGSWRQVCGGATTEVPGDAGASVTIGGEPPAQPSEIWERLGEGTAPGAAPDELVQRYVRARFPGELRGPPADKLWACHLDLSRYMNPSSFPVGWDQEVSVPHAYDVEAGAVRSQLELDALLPLLREGGDAGVCWGLVSARLARYTPAHPLAGGVDDKSAWSVEQQVCTQACAVRYQLASPAAGEWITPTEDLRACVSTATPPQEWPPDLGRGTLDRLGIPWFGAGAAARAPSQAEVCAFNLVANDRFPAGEGGFLASGVDPVVWAGETSAGSHIAGGPLGEAAHSAQNLSSYGQSRSRQNCANVAAQCFAGLLVEIAADRSVERYRWPAEWASAVERVANVGRNGAMSPWCSLIAPHLSTTGALPEGQFNVTCAQGVEDERARVAESVASAARGDALPAKGSP